MNQFDLNLLQIFDALFELRSTTRAADRLGLTQSAVSHALRRLREALGDPLFVRSGRSLQPTARALEIAPELHAGLVQLRAALAPSEFDPATVQRTITLAVGSYFCALIAPRLIAWARQVASGLTIRLVALDKELPALLESGSVDLALGVFQHVPDRFVTEPVFFDAFAWIAAENHPLAGRMVTRDEIDAFPLLQIGTVHPFGLPSSMVEIRQVSEPSSVQLPQGKIPSAIVYDGTTAIATVGATDMVALVPMRLAENLGPRLGVVPLKTRSAQLTLTLSALWHSRLRQDAGFRWLLDRMKEF